MNENLQEIRDQQAIADKLCQEQNKKLTTHFVKLYFFILCLWQIFIISVMLYCIFDNLWRKFYQ